MNRRRLALELRRARRPFVVWIALLALGATSGTILVRRLDVGVSHKYTVHIAVPDAKGFVAPYSEVRIAGVRVGRITHVAYDGNTAVLTASIDPSAGPLYRNARLRLRPNSPLEDMLVEVQRGTPSAGRVPDGGSLSADHTASPVSISQVLDIFDASVRPRVTELLTELGRGLADNGAALRASLVGLGPFLHVARETADAAATRTRITRRLVHNLGLLTTELGDRNRTVADLVSSSSTTARAVSVVDRPFGQLLEDLPPLLRQLPQTLSTVRATADELDPALTALRPAATALAPALRSLTSFGATARGPLRALAKPIPALTRVLSSLPNSTTPLAGSFAALRPQAPRLERMTNAILPCRTNIQRALERLLSVTKYQDSNGAYVRVDDVVGAEVGGAVEVPYYKHQPGCALAKAGR